MPHRLAVVAAALLAFLGVTGCESDSVPPAVGDWPSYRSDPAGTGHSPLEQVNTGNVGGLVPIWSYSLEGAPEADGPGVPARSQATPIVVDGVMYAPAADRVVAIDPTSGAEVWVRALEAERPSRRGVAYWEGTTDIAPRILFTAGSRLVALEAETGEPAAGFGTGGEIDLGIPYNSVPLVHDGIVVVGANTPPGEPGGIGNARAYDAASGEPLWEFNSVPRPGEVGHDTWEGDGWVDRLGVNAWPFYFTVDAERGLVFLPLAAPIPFAYGGDRPGDNLFGNSVVAVDLRTGAYVWHFQTIHHDLWDHDPPAPPVLFDLEGAGGLVPALGLTTKSGYLYVLNRVTGEPVHGVREIAVPASEVPGERASPTQPVPTVTPPLARVSYTAADLVTGEDTSPEHAEACAVLVAGSGELVNEGPFTPWVHRRDGSERATLLFPGLVGGPNWGGVAFDPDSGLLIAFSQDVGSIGWMEEASDGSTGAFVRSGPRPSTFDVSLGAERLPCQRPPWGTLTAVDASSGEVVWVRPVGVSESLPDNRRDTGRPGRAGAIVTAGGLAFIASTDDARFRALDTTTGETLWTARLEAQGNANPMTYLGPDGRQYVAIAATDRIVAFGLPNVP